MNLDSLTALFVDELLDLQDAEAQLVKAIPKMIDAANSVELKESFEDHLEQTKVHGERLERILKLFPDRPRSKSCKAIAGLIKEGSERVYAKGDPAVIDAGLISAAQRIEHYEIAGYGCARTYAQLLGESASASILQETLEEEKGTDEKLTFLAESIINPQAARA